MIPWMTTIPFRMAMVIPGGIDKMEFKKRELYGDVLRLVAAGGEPFAWNVCEFYPVQECSHSGLYDFCGFLPDRLLPFALRFEFAVESLFVRGGGGFVGFCLCVFYVLFARTGEAEWIFLGELSADDVPCGVGNLLHFQGTFCRSGKCIAFSCADFGVYLIHPLFIQLFDATDFSLLVPHPFVTVPIAASAFFMLSLLLTMLLRLLPRLRKVIWARLPSFGTLFELKEFPKCADCPFNLCYI